MHGRKLLRNKAKQIDRLLGWTLNPVCDYKPKRLQRVTYLSAYEIAIAKADISVKGMDDEGEPTSFKSSEICGAKAKSWVMRYPARGRDMPFDINDVPRSIMLTKYFFYLYMIFVCESNWKLVFDSTLLPHSRSLIQHWECKAARVGFDCNCELLAIVTSSQLLFNLPSDIRMFQRIDSNKKHSIKE